ncbi:hypothetical protein GVN24_26875 [Rhizobium sp. CRIBSB]|nr:hypothetical protein [Rhizobium sp. CRIBSB]
METDPLLPEIAVDFIQKCKRTGRKVLGVDRLFLRQGTFILDLEAIADFTMDPNGVRDLGADADAACAFIRSSTTKDSVFTITVE